MENKKYTTGEWFGFGWLTGFVVGCLLAGSFGYFAISTNADSNTKLTQERNTYKQAYLKANTLLKYHDSINNSGLIINLSKYQLEYVKSKLK